MKNKPFKGFTLAELLIALAILGVIATFTIPKVLNSATSGQNTAIAKEVASTVSGAFSAYTLNNSITTTTTAGMLTSLMNYVRTTTISSGGTNAIDCTAAGVTCLQLHSGAYLGLATNQSFTGSGNYLVFAVDPDGTGTGAGTGSIILYDNGRMTTGQNRVGTIGSNGVAGLLVTTDPSYLTW